MFAIYSDSIIAPMCNRRAGQDISDSSITSDLKQGVAVVFIAVMFWLLFPKTFYQFQAGAQNAAAATANRLPYLMVTALTNERAHFRCANADSSNEPATIISLAGGTPASLAGEVFSLLLKRG